MALLRRRLPGLLWLLRRTGLELESRLWCEFASRFVQLLGQAFNGQAVGALVVGRDKVTRIGHFARKPGNARQNRVGAVLALSIGE